MKIFDIKSIQFQQIINDAQAWLSKTIGSVKEINKSTVFGQLITVISAISHNIFKYIEDSLVEQNKYTAQRKKSIYGLAALSGYEPSTGKAAGVWVKIHHMANNMTNCNLILPNRSTIVCSQNGMYYNIVMNTESTVIKSDTLGADRYFYAVQGKFETQRFTSTGGSLYSQNLKYIGNIDTGHIEVRVNGEIWNQEASIYDMAPNGKCYTVRINPIDGIDIVFGTGVNGKILNPGDTISVTYLLHDGESGNIDTRETGSFYFTNKLLDVTGVQVDPNSVLEVSFASKDSVAAGSNAEDIYTVRSMIGFNSRSLVLADSNAYKAFLNKFAFVGYNRTWSEPGSLVLNSLIMKNYKLNMKEGGDYFKLTADDFKLSDYQRAQLKNALMVSGIQIAGSIYNILDIELYKYALFIYVNLKSKDTDHTLIENKIRKLIGDFFGDVNSDSYIPKSDIINTIKNNCPEIDGVNCYFLSEKNETALKNGWYEKVVKKYNPLTGTWTKNVENVAVVDGENPNLGFDAHGNILIDENEQFPVLMGGWSWKNSKGDDVEVIDPLTIVFE